MTTKVFCPPGAHQLYLSVADLDRDDVRYSGCLVCDLPPKVQAATNQIRVVTRT